MGGLHGCWDVHAGCTRPFTVMADTTTGAFSCHTIAGRSRHASHEQAHTHTDTHKRTRTPPTHTHTDPPFINTLASLLVPNATNEETLNRFFNSDQANANFQDNEDFRVVQGFFAREAQEQQQQVGWVGVKWEGGRVGGWDQGGWA